MQLIFDYVRIGAAAALYVFAIFGWGDAMARVLFRAPKPDFWDYALGRIVAGCATIYAFYIGLGALGFLRPAAVWTVLAGGVIAAVAGLDQLRSRFEALLANFRSWDRTERGLTGACIALTVLQLLCALTPLIFYDLQVYQLVAPSQFLKYGRLVEIPWNVLTNSPMALQLTLGSSLVMDSQGAVTKLLVAVFGCLLPVAVTRLVSNRKAALLAALFVLCYPEFWTHQTFGVVDLAVAAFLILGVSWTPSSPVLAGCAFGFVIGSRYQGIVPTVWVTAAVLIDHVRNQRGIDRSILLRFAAIAIIASLFAAPWLIRNTSNFGDPVYPLLSGVFGAPGWSAAQSERLNQEVFGPQLNTLPAVRWATAPISALLMMPSNGLFGLSLILGALMALFASREHDVRMAAILGMGGLILWSLLQPTPNVHLMRFNAGSIALLMTATAGVLASEWIPAQRGIYAGLALAGGSLLIAIPFVQSINPVLQTLVDPGYREAVWHANVPSWEAFEFVNSTLDATKHKVLTIGETRGFWLRIPFLAPTAFDTERLYSVFSGADPSVWRKKLEDLGVTHLLISYPEWNRLRDNYNYLRFAPDDLSRLNAWFRTLRVVFDDTRGTVVVEVK